MYNVDVDRIIHLLEYGEGIIEEGAPLYAQMAKDESPSVIHLLASQRVLQIQFEVFTDVVNLLIDGFVMRDPGGYEDMVDIMDDEQVITERTSQTLRALIAFYRDTVKDYDTYHLPNTADIYRAEYPHLTFFGQEVRTYLQKELPAHREF